MVLQFILILLLTLTNQQNPLNSLNANTVSLTPPLNWDCIKLTIPTVNFTDSSICTKLEDSLGWSCCYYSMIVSGKEQNIKDFNAGGCLPVLTNITNNYTAYSSYMSNVIIDNRDETTFIFNCESLMFNLYWSLIIFIILSFVF